MNIKEKYAELRNRKFNSDMERIEKRGCQLYYEKGDVVVCIYCGKLMPKTKAVFVYNITDDTGEFSHEDCWDKSNEVGDDLSLSDGQKGVVAKCRFSFS